MKYNKLKENSLRKLNELIVILLNQDDKDEDILNKLRNEEQEFNSLDDYIEQSKY